MGHDCLCKTIGTIGNRKSKMTLTRLLTFGLCLLLVIETRAQSQNTRIGLIEFFGASGVETQKVKETLAVYEGQDVSFDQLPDLRLRVTQAVKSIGYEPTDVAPVCCNSQGHVVVFVGLPGKNYRSFSYNPVPHGAATLPPEVVNLYQQAMDLLLESIQKQGNENDSKGYALSTYPPLRAKQIAMHEYAIRNEAVIHRVLLKSGDAEQRAVAAELLGYANHSTQQIISLVRASRDSNGGVRNNAIRALAVLANSNERAVRSIPANNFVSMLNSGKWTDRNKGSFLLDILTRRRDPKLLFRIRQQALESLIEMARWQDPSHVDDARIILGRVAGIPEKQLGQLVAEHKVDVIIAALAQKRTRE
jgi:hypothetical protein